MSLEEIVMDGLGKPKGFLHCRVVQLWENRYRVNVWNTTTDETGLNHYGICDAFFVVYDVKSDKIKRCSPDLKKKY